MRDIHICGFPEALTLSYRKAYLSAVVILAHITGSFSMFDQLLINIFKNVSNNQTVLLQVVGQRAEISKQILSSSVYHLFMNRS